MPELDQDSVPLVRAAWAERLGSVATESLSREYPYAAHHTTVGPEDRPLPVQIHPAFGTSYDWHSSVHMHWLAARTIEFGVSPQLHARLTGLLEAHLTPVNVAAEVGYLAANPYYERPYGWAWAMRLAAALATSDALPVSRLAASLAPLVDTVEANTLSWLARAAHPVRHGVHSNTAFGLMLILQAARILQRAELVDACEQMAWQWFGADRGWPFEWERSGQDFLSPGLAEADLMREVARPDEFPLWAEQFFSQLTAGSELLDPVLVRDQQDGHQAHLFGLDLSRAGAARRVGAVLSDTSADRVSRLLIGAADQLLPAALQASVGSEYVSTHWLASFAWDALEAREAR
ncbi:DUF2891 family protein [Curtobacterium ammoniigenes]|uniref:DUF2891 family protein n=1 Tax=Curtobacterium ammoniigenes TaxID=395387 RepID=UPI000AB253EE|nr:DUF2891 family protein [Curtobacterium ammoniigenes]